MNGEKVRMYRNFDNFMLAKPIIPSSGIRAGKKRNQVCDDKEKAGSLATSSTTSSDSIVAFLLFT